MPYQLLTNVTNFDTLLQDIRDFLNATGDWTLVQDMIAPDEDGPDTNPTEHANLALGSQLIVRNDDCLAGLRSTTGGAGKDKLYLFDGIGPYSSGTLDTMNGNSGNRYTGAGIVNAGGDQGCRGLQVHPGPFPKAYLFSNDPSTYLHCAMEVSAGVFKHLLFGNMIKFGTWTGGGYYATSWWSTDDNNIDQPSGQHAIPFDNYSPLGSTKDWTIHYEFGADKWIAPTETANYNGVVRNLGRGSLRGGFNKMFKNIPESTFTGLIPLAPVVIQAVRTSDTPDTTRFIGQIPDFRMINIQNIAPADIITIGSDEYMCFPLVAKNGAVDQYNSGVSGIAYKMHT